MQPAQLGGTALTKRRVSSVHRKAQRRHLPKAAVYPSDCLPGARIPGPSWKQADATCARDLSHRSLRPTPTAAADVIAHAAVRHKYASATRHDCRGQGTLLCASSQRAQLVLSLRFWPLKPDVMANATIRHHCAMVPPSTAGSRRVLVSLGSRAGPT